jgi:ubiquinone/menaquinone biosynthesis C-methylase UbiE
MAGIVVNVEIGEEKSQKDYYDKATHYNLIWGEDNIHLGYYPHLGVCGGNDVVVLNNKQAAQELTRRMIDVARINHKSNVLDLGCGKGQSMRVVQEITGAKCTGIDISTTNIERANEWVAEKGLQSELTFYEGSFTELPSEVLAQKYDVIFSQVAFCHVHMQLPAIFQELQKVLAPGGVVIVNDYLGCDLDGGASEQTKEHTWKRLHFEYLHGHQAWRKIADEAGLVIDFYENLDKHMVQTYLDMAMTAEQHNIKSADGADLCINYRQTASNIQGREVGMNLALLTMPSA